MANKCAICGAEINVFQTQKLVDGNCICRKSCRSAGFKIFDYMHASLPQVKAHLEQVKRGTSLWEHYFVPKLKEKDKAKKLVRFGAHVYIAEDLGLMAFTQVNYKILLFCKTTRACVYRIADIRDYEYEKREVKNGDKTETKGTIRMSFANTEGMYEFYYFESSYNNYKNLVKYFDKLFGIQKTLGNLKNNVKNQFNAAKDVASGLRAAMSGDENMEEKAAQAAQSIDTAQLGDRTALEERADAALSAFRG